jgi:hypothetical protein
MGKINWKGVVLGGLLAGVVLNVVDWVLYGMVLSKDYFGAGAKTGVIAGLAVWFFISFLHALGEAPMQLFPQRLYAIGVVVALFQLPIATAVGAYLYKEA